jgi:hypothetical protein
VERKIHYNLIRVIIYLLKYGIIIASIFSSIFLRQVIYSANFVSNKIYKVNLLNNKYQKEEMWTTDYYMLPAKSKSNKLHCFCWLCVLQVALCGWAK